MAAKRKSKPATRKPAAAKKAPSRRTAPKPKAPKRRASRPSARRNPPMHAVVKNPELDDAAHDEVFETFKAFDRDGSGSIDRAELARLLEALGQPIDEAELEVALDVIDTNRSGRVSWPEFKAWWTSR